MPKKWPGTWQLEGHQALLVADNIPTFGPWTEEDICQRREYFISNVRVALIGDE